MTNSVKEEKNSLRKQYKMLRESLSPETRKSRDTDLCRHAASLAGFRYARYVLLYDAKDTEISLHSLAMTALEKGKLIAYPRCDSKTCTMKYYIVSSPDDLSEGLYGIREPSPDLPEYSPESCYGDAVCFVPGLLFDRNGYRLGYGKGYYDRFLNTFPGNTVGVIYSDFILPTVPRGWFDKKVNVLITEKNVINIKAENEN